ncbi:hypothetical protein Hanom_Chr06g00565261 [Helianthus anomalus]
MGCVRMQGMRRGRHGMRWEWTLQHLKGHLLASHSWTLQGDTQTPPMWKSPSTDVRT